MTELPMKGACHVEQNIPRMPCGPGAVHKALMVMQGVQETVPTFTKIW